jgi:hypothetical protein
MRTMMSMSDRVTAEAYRLLQIRLERMLHLVVNHAPMSMVAAECGLIGKLEPMLDPEGWAHRNTSRVINDMKQSLGICLHDGCERHAVNRPDNVGQFGDRLLQSADMCTEHAAKIEAELADFKGPS